MFGPLYLNLDPPPVVNAPARAEVLGAEVAALEIASEPFDGILASAAIQLANASLDASAAGGLVLNASIVLEGAQVHSSAVLVATTLDLGSDPFIRSEEFRAMSRPAEVRSLFRPAEGRTLLRPPEGRGMTR